MLLARGDRGGRVAASQLAAAERLQSNQLPTISPLLDGWQLAGWTAQAALLGGDFHDWFCLADGLLAVAAGHAMDRGIEAALAATAMKAALRAHGQYYREAQQTLRRLNLTMWTGSAGDQHGTLLFGLIQTSTGKGSFASAGQPGMILLRQDGWQSLSHVSPRLGESPESDYEQFGHPLQPGEVLVIFTEGVRDADRRPGLSFGRGRCGRGRVGAFGSLGRGVGVAGSRTAGPSWPFRPSARPHRVGGQAAGGRRPVIGLTLGIGRVN